MSATPPGRPGRLTSVAEGQTEKRLANGQAVLARLRLKILVSMLLLGLATLCISEFAWLYFLWIDMPLAPDSWAKYLWAFLLSFGLCNRFVFFGLAALADDMPTVRLSMAMDIATLMLPELIQYTLKPERLVRLLRPPYQALIFMISNVVLLIVFIRVCRCRTASSMSEHMWFALYRWICVRILANLCAGIYSSLKNHSLSYDFFWIPPQLLMLVFTSRPALRQLCHKWMNKTFERRSQRLAAAGVAGLVGRCSVDEVVAQAQSRFRSVRLADLSFEDIEDNRPNPALFVKTAPETLHLCDAFVSHSWHDDARAKWTAIQEWRKGFVDRYGREPKVWFDKSCIDQNSIASDLRCLPIFLSGCRRMVVFCGPTYLSRLWCIVELFTFVHMGRSVDKIDFVLVQREGHEGEDRDEVEESFDDFDAGKCQCFLAEDKERIHSIIQTAFGALSGFNQAVKDIFRRSRMEEALMRQWSTVGGRTPAAAIGRFGLADAGSLYEDSDASSDMTCSYSDEDESEDGC